jgi:hypothetical protein
MLLCLIMAFLVASAYPSPIKRHTTSRQTAILPQMRAISAAQERQNHQQFLLLNQKNLKIPGVLNQPARVGIDFKNIMQTSSTIFYYDDMEHGTNGWTVQTSGEPALWHQTTLDATSPTHSWWCGVESQQNYDIGDTVSQGLVSPQIDLSGASGPVGLMFSENYYTEAGWDFCMVDVSTNGGAQWIHLRGGYATSPSGDSHGWRFTTLDLTPYAGKQINIRFYFDTGDTTFNDFTGWFVDNVIIYDQAGSIAGSVYLDMNRNGQRDFQDQNLSGMVISVTGPITLTTTSDRYSSIPLPLGSYQVTQILQAPWTQTTSPDTWSVNLTYAGQRITGLDFGDYRPGSIIQGIVFDDRNQNGIMDDSDSRIYYQYVYAYDSTDTKSVAYAISNDSGQYNLFVTDTGRCYIRSYPPYPWALSFPTGNPPEYIINIPGHDTLLGDYLFGLYELPPGIIEGSVFNDINHNSVWDSTESGLPSWIVHLTDTLYRPKATITTDSAGYYVLNNLVDGWYFVYLELKATWIQTLPSYRYKIYVYHGQVFDNRNFGVYYPPRTTIRGIVFDDKNNNGILENSDSLLTGWTIYAFDSTGTRYITAVSSDDSGRCNLLVYDTGWYRIRENPTYHWTPTVPRQNPQEYLVDVSRLDTVLDGYFFGNFRLPSGVVQGSVFEDINRNGIRDQDESGLTSWIVNIIDSNVVQQTIQTDGSGNYLLSDVPVGMHSISLSSQLHWIQSLPVANYQITVDSGQTIDSIDFGVYALSPGSISGIVYDDVDRNGVRDAGEPAMKGARINLTGQAIASAVTDDSGRYTFPGLWSGSYSLNVVIHTQWHQTSFVEPLYLGNEQNLTSANVGVAPDSTFITAFRTFLVDSIAYAKDNTGRLGNAVKLKATASEATFKLVVPIGALTGLHAEFSQTIDSSSLTVTHSPLEKHDVKYAKWDFDLPTPETFITGDTVKIFAHGNKGNSLIINKYWWKQGTVGPAPGTSKVSRVSGQGSLLFSMPNVINVLNDMYSLGLPAPGIVVGVYGPHSEYNKNSSDVVKSLRDNHGTHSGPARCLGIYSNNLQPIKKAVRTLPPTKGNNKLFAQALALKVNIQASDFLITPHGLGELIFRDTIPNALSGISLRKISEKLDTALSAFDDRRRIRTTANKTIWIGGDTCICDSNTFKEFYRTIQMINLAFSGPFDTVSFVNKLIVASVRDIAFVPFLRLDSSFSKIASVFTDNPRIPELPKQFVLQQNYPNPFNPSTTIEFYLTRPSIVSMKLYNQLGQEVATLLDRQALDDGWNRFTMSADTYRLASGVYYYRLVAEVVPDDDNPMAQKVSIVKKMLFIK